MFPDVTPQEEALRIEASGGVVFDKCVMGVLTVSRALGHSPLKALVTGNPSVSRTMLQPSGMSLATSNLVSLQLLTRGDVHRRYFSAGK